MTNIYSLYPQFMQLTDRRNQNISVGLNRRSGMDRRELARIPCDSYMYSDIRRTEKIFAPFLNHTNNIPAHIKIKDKKASGIRRALFAALSPIIPIRRISSLPDNIEDGNYTRAAGLVGLMLVNLPEDTRDLKAAWDQIIKGELPKYNYREYQAPFSFFRGTVFEPIVNRLGKIGIMLHKIDTSLFDTGFGQFLRNKLKIEVEDFEITGRSVPKVILDEAGKIMVKNKIIYAVKLTGNKLSKLIGRTLLRIPCISVIMLSLLELPAICKSFSQEKNTKNKIITGLSQMLKSAINVVSILSGIGIVGALLSRRGPAYSVLGMGIGSVIGSLISSQAAKGIDNFCELSKNVNIYISIFSVFRSFLRFPLSVFFVIPFIIPANVALKGASTTRSSPCTLPIQEVLLEMFLD